MKKTGVHDPDDCCLHYVGTRIVHMTQGTFKRTTYICCHCNRESVVDVLVEEGPQSWVFDKRAHGPYLPDSTPQFSLYGGE